jgi:hypothetical protein
MAADGPNRFILACPNCGSPINLAKLSFGSSFDVCPMCGARLRLSSAAPGLAFVLGVACASIVSFATGVRGFSLILIVPILSFVFFFAANFVIGLVLPRRLIWDQSGKISSRLDDSVRSKR